MVTDSLPAVSAEDEEPAAEASDPFVWTDAANERLQRAPEGFMRLAARRTVEDYAKENGIAEITLDVAEEGLAIAREQMGEAMRSGMTMQSPHPSKDQREENEPTDETGSFECQLCGYVVDGKRPAHCSACGVGDLKKLTEEERDIVSTTATITLEWDEKALARLERVPAGFMRTMTRCRIEQWARKFARDRVSLDVVEAKYASWAEGSQGLQMELDWSADAVQRIERIPDFIRPRVVREIEGHARAVGQSRVTGDVLDRVMSNWGGAQGGFHAAAG
jgi:rubrerythrin